MQIRCRSKVLFIDDLANVANVSRGVVWPLQAVEQYLDEFAIEISSCCQLGTAVLQRRHENAGIRKHGAVAQRAGRQTLLHLARAMSVEPIPYEGIKLRLG